MPTEEEIKEQEEEKDGEKLALGLVGAGILAAGTAVAVSKLADKGGDVRVQKHYTDITSDMNSIPIIDIDNRRPPGVVDMAQEEPVQPLPPDPPVQNTVMEEPQPPQQPEPVEPTPPAGGAGGYQGGGGGGGYQPQQPPQQQPQPPQEPVEPTDPGETPTNPGETPITPGESGPDLTITVPEIEAFITKLKSSSKNIQDYWEEIFKKQIVKLKDSWAGPDMEKYIEKISDLDPKVAKAVEAVNLLMDTYKKALAEYEKQVKKLKAAVKG